MQQLKNSDPEVYAAIGREIGRQSGTLEMIASENFVSEAVLQAMGTPLTNKYAEGYPGKRYYGGCQYVDEAEELARKRVCELFGAEYANVQPHAGSQANMATYMSLIDPGDTILGMDLTHGGHLTHGSHVNFSGILYNVVAYGVREEDRMLDYEQVESLAEEHKPKMIVAGASAYPRTIDFPRLRRIADSVGAWLVVDIAHPAGLIASGLFPSPVGHAHVVTSTTHKTLRGPRGGLILSDQELGKKIDKKIFPGIQGGPMMHVIAAKAVAFREALSDDFKDYSRRVIANARKLGEVLTAAGYDLVTGGTDSHILLVDLTNRDMTGKQAEEALEESGITVNKNTVPFEKRSPFVTSGIRIGTAALTTRGMGEAEMERIGAMIDRVLSEPEADAVRKQVRTEVERLCEDFPIYDGLLVG